MLISKKTHCGRCGTGVTPTTKTFEMGSVLLCISCSRCGKKQEMCLRVGDVTGAPPHQKRRARELFNSGLLGCWYEL